MSAFSLKDALMEANDRSSPNSPTRVKTVAQMAGYFNTNPIQRIKMRIPIFTTDDEVFGGSLIDNENLAPTISGDVEMGTIVEYQSRSGSQYGIITEPAQNSQAKGAYVKKIEKKEAEDIQKKDPKTKKITIDEKSLKPLKEKNNVFIKSFNFLKKYVIKLIDNIVLIYLFILLIGFTYVIYLLFK
jgi:hypothetical protein